MFSASRSVEHLVWFNRAGQRLSSHRRAVRPPEPDLFARWEADARRGFRRSGTKRDLDGGARAGIDHPLDRRTGCGRSNRLTAPTSRSCQTAWLASPISICARERPQRRSGSRFRSPENKSICDWLPDGRSLLYVNTSPRTKADLWLLPLIGPRQPVPLLQTSFNELQGQISPDGRWIAYTSDESGSWQVYVQSFPALGAKRAISVGGGWDPHWRRDGKELFYVGADRSIMAVSIGPGPAFEAGPVDGAVSGADFRDQRLPHGLCGERRRSAVPDRCDGRIRQRRFDRDHRQLARRHEALTATSTRRLGGRRPRLQSAQHRDDVRPCRATFAVQTLVADRFVKRRPPALVLHVQLGAVARAGTRRSAPSRAARPRAPGSSLRR